MPVLDKAEVLSALRAHIERDLEAALASQRHAQESAVHEEARSEGDKDTRATETSYLARGLAVRVVELEEASRRLAVMTLPVESEEVTLGALVRVHDVGTERHACYFVAPAGAGVTLEVGGESVAVVTPKAPLGRALLGKEPGDDVELEAPRGRRSLEIEDVW